MTSADNNISSKISGYLEKKKKLRIGSPWRKYWFVLEGRLLLYYRSKDEYDTIRPCKGSVSLCPPCNVKLAQNTSCTFQIEGRYSTVTLRAENRIEQERWMQAIMLSTSQTKTTSHRMNHFRYSLDDLPVHTNKINEENPPAITRQNTLPYRFKSPKRDKKQLLNKSQSNNNYDGASNFKSAGALNNLIPKEKCLKSPCLPKNKNLSRLLIHSSSLYNVIVNDRRNEYKSENFLNKSQSCEEIIDVSDDNKNWRSESHLRECTFTEKDDEENGTNGNCLLDNKVEDIDRKIERNACNSKFHEEALYEELQDIFKSETPKNETSFENVSRNDSFTKDFSKSKFKNSRIGLFMKFNKSAKENDENVPKKITRNQSFVKKMWKRKAKILEIEKQEPMEKLISKEHVLKTGSDIKLMLELQKIEESRKQSLKNNITNFETKIDKKVEDRIKIVKSAQIIDEYDMGEKPSLPPRKNLRPVSPYHDTPRTTNPIFDKNKSSSSVTKFQDSEAGSYKTIEEILTELNEKNDSESNIKQDVVLRKRLTPEVTEDQRNRNPFNNSQDTFSCSTTTAVIRYSSDLGVLLEELTKITSAPILTPGSTFSLTAPFIEPTERKNSNRRRLSDPDYDIPRPHLSLQFNSKKKLMAENVIPATQFFGPVLQPLSPPIIKRSEIHFNITLPRITSCSSIDPDSLEPTRLNHSTSNSSEGVGDNKKKKEWEEHNISYISHDYNQKYHHCNDEIDDKKTISYNYNVHKESYISYNDKNEFDVKMNQEKKEILYNFKEELKRVEKMKGNFKNNQEQLIDSLEPLTESSTTF